MRGENAVNLEPDSLVVWDDIDLFGRNGEGQDRTLPWISHH